MVLGELPVPGSPTILITVRVVWTFLLSSVLSSLSPSLWETVRYRLNYCLKGPLNPNQPTNQLSLYQISLILHQLRNLGLC